MKRFIAAASTTTTPASAVESSFAMSARSTTTATYRGGRRQRRGGFSDCPGSGGRGQQQQQQFVTGDSHFQSVRDANSGYRRRGFDFNHFRQQPPRNYYQNHQQFDQNQHRQKPPDYREWEYNKNADSQYSNTFKVLSYNILADYLAFGHRRLYSHIPNYVLDWEARKRSILLELRLWSSDIMCFQEVDRFQDLEKGLKVQGYSGIWKMRTGNAVDGCAIFWRNSRFKLLYEESVEFREFGLRDNVAQICVFELMTHEGPGNTYSQSTSVIDSNKVVVCNIHVLYNPRRGEMKLGQVRMLLAGAHEVSKVWGNAPVVLCGDFNCTPKSPLYNFITEQKLDVFEVCRDKVSGQDSVQISFPRQKNSSHNPDPNFVAKSLGHENKPQEDAAPASASYQVLLHEHHESNSDTEITRIKFDVLSISQESSSINSSEHQESQMNDEHDGPSITGEPSGSCASTANDVGEEKLEDMFTDQLNDSPLAAEIIANDEAPDNLPLEPDSNIADEEIPVYDPSSWTPMEIATATGNPEITVLDHPLKLKSTYAEVEGGSETRDANGEPPATSYNRHFLGTVDYIWRSEGLQTIKVLAPIPKVVLQGTRGFPTKKWGSDHIALASELAFVNASSDANI